MTRVSMPLRAASSNELITLRSVSRYISIQTDFLAPLIASVMTRSPALGSTNTCTPCAPDPTAQLLPWQPLPPELAVLITGGLPVVVILAVHAVRSTQSATVTR